MCDFSFVSCAVKLDNTKVEVIEWLRGCIRRGSSKDHTRREMEKIWTIIRFIEEDTVEAVPSTWIINNKCYWPPFPSDKIVAAIKKHAEPNTCWPSYDITTFRNSSYDNYGTAREKARKAEFTSDLTSETDNDKVGKRKIFKKIYSSSDEEVEEYTKIRMPPTIKESSKSTCGENTSSNKHQLQAVNSVAGKVSYERSKHISETVWDTCNNYYSSQNDEREVQDNETEYVCNKTVLQYFKEIIRQQSYFKTQLWQMADDVRDIKNDLLQQTLQRQNVNQNMREESIYSFSDLPFNSVKDLEEHVQQFLNQPNNFKASVAEMSRIGGKSPYEFIKRNCSRLLTNELAEKYSWFGAKAKRKFCDLKLADLLVVSGMENDSTNSKKVLEEAIQKWLRRAKERLDAERKKLQN